MAAKTIVGVVSGTRFSESSGQPGAGHQSTMVQRRAHRLAVQLRRLQRPWRLLLLPLLILLLLSELFTTQARPIGYYDVPHLRIALGNPPGLDPPPGPGSGWLENADVTALLFQHWDAAVLRTFYRKGSTTQRTFVALVGVDGGAGEGEGNGTRAAATRAAYLDLGEGYLEFNRPHMAVGSEYRTDACLTVGVSSRCCVTTLQSNLGGWLC